MQIQNTRDREIEHKTTPRLFHTATFTKLPSAILLFKGPLSTLYQYQLLSFVRCTLLWQSEFTICLLIIPEVMGGLLWSVIQKPLKSVFPHFSFNGMISDETNQFERLASTGLSSNRGLLALKLKGACGDCTMAIFSFL